MATLEEKMDQGGAEAYNQFTPSGGASATPMNMPQALGVIMAESPQVGELFLNQYKVKVAGKKMLESLRDAGFDLSTPSGAVLEGLLKSGVVDPEKAARIYTQLQRAELNNIEMQVKYADIYLKRALADLYKAQTYQTYRTTQRGDAQAAVDLVNQLYAPRLQRIENEKKEIRSILNDPNLLPRLNPREIRRLEIRLKALDITGQMLSHERRTATQQVAKLVSQGVPIGNAIPRAVGQGIVDTRIAFRNANFKGVMELPSDQDVIYGRELANEFVDVVSLYGSPEYGAFMKELIQLNTGGVMDPNIGDNLPKALEDNDSNFWRNTLIAGGSILAGLALIKKGKLKKAWETASKWFRRSKKGVIDKKAEAIRKDFGTPSLEEMLGSGAQIRPTERINPITGKPEPVAPSPEQARAGIIRELWKKRQERRAGKPVSKPRKRKKELSLGLRKKAKPDTERLINLEPPSVEGALGAKGSKAKSPRAKSKGAKGSRTKGSKAKRKKEE